MMKTISLEELLEDVIGKLQKLLENESIPEDRKGDIHSIIAQIRLVIFQYSSRNLCVYKRSPRSPSLLHR